MSGGAGTVLLVAPFTGAMEKELIDAGFEVVSVTSAFNARAAAAGRTFTAYVAPSSGAPSLRALPALRGAPGVCVASKWLGWGISLWPMFPFPRGAVGLVTSDLKRPGKLADAVRTAIARRTAAPAARARVGEALWRLGAALQLVWILATLPVLAWRIAGHRGDGAILIFQGAFWAGAVLSDVGGSLAVERRVRLSAFSWFGVFWGALGVAGYLASRLFH